MPDTKITDLAAFSVLATNDLLVAVDVSDTLMAGTGTDKQLTANQLISSLTGDITNSGFAITVAKVNGVAFPASPATNTVPIVTASNTVTYRVPVNFTEVLICGAV